MRLFEQNRLGEARSIAQRLVQSHPSADAYLLLADLAREQDDFAVAMRSLQAAAKLAPDCEDAYLEFSEIAGDHGNAQLALESAEIGLENVPGSYRLKIQKGVALDKLGRFDEANSILREAAAQKEDNSLALLSLSVVLTHAGKLEDADKILVGALDRSPRNYYMHYFRGKLLLQLASGSPDSDALRARANDEFDTSLRYNPEHADSYYQLSTLSPRSDLEEAALIRCLKIDPRHGPAQYALARLYIRTGRKAQGQAILVRYKTQQRAAELEQDKQLRIDVAQR